MPILVTHLLCAVAGSFTCAVIFVDESYFSEILIRMKSWADDIGAASGRRCGRALHAHRDGLCPSLSLSVYLSVTILLCCSLSLSLPLSLPLSLSLTRAVCVSLSLSLPFAPSLSRGAWLQRALHAHRNGKLPPFLKFTNLSHRKCWCSRFAEVNSLANPSTHHLPLLISRIS